MSMTGDVIEESLQDKKILSTLKIIQTRIEDVTPEHKTPWLDKWTLHTIEVEESQAAEVAGELCQALEQEHPWYVDYRNTKSHYVIFKDKVFKIDRAQKSQYQEAKDYGVSLGIPIYQLDDLELI